MEPGGHTHPVDGQFWAMCPLCNYGAGAASQPPVPAWAVALVQVADELSAEWESDEIGKAHATRMFALMNRLKSVLAHLPAEVCRAAEEAKHG